jgi:hypothetical protein
MAADPRLADIPQSVNETIQDRAIRHALFLERFKTQEVRRILALLEDAQDNALNLLQRRLLRIEAKGFDLGPETTKRLQRLAASMETIIQQASTKTLREVTGSFTDLATREATFQAGVIKKSLPVEWEFTVPSATKLRSVVTARPFQGGLLKEWFGELSRVQQAAVRRELRLGMALGETIPQITRRFRGTKAKGFTDGIFGLGRRQTETLVRTSVSHVSSHAREAMFEANQDLIKGVQWVLTLDLHTCMKCVGRAEKVTSLGVGVYPVGSGPRPPDHHNCRCTTTAVTKSWNELGIDLAEAPTGTRASMNGQVPADLSYSDWLRRQSPDMQDDALGKKRGALFRTGELEVGDFTNRQNKVITLDDLQSLESDAFAALE